MVLPTRAACPPAEKAMSEMTNDHLYFLCILAGSSATIVALIGAVPGSQILAHLGQLKQAKELLWARIEGVRTRIELERSTLSGARDQNQRQLAQMGETPNPDQRADYQRRLRYAETDVAHYGPLEGEVSEKGIGEYEAKLDALAEVQTNDKRRVGPNATDQNKQLLSVLRNEVAEFRHGLLPRSFGLVLGVLVYFAAAGVFLPLLVLVTKLDWSFDPFEQPWWHLFALFTGGLVALVAYFTWQLVELRRLGTLTWKRWGNESATHHQGTRHWIRLP